MKALQYVSPGAILLRVTAAGVCHSDDFGAVHFRR